MVPFKMLRNGTRSLTLSILRLLFCYTALGEFYKRKNKVFLGLYIAISFVFAIGGCSLGFALWFVLVAPLEDAFPLVLPDYAGASVLISTLASFLLKASGMVLSFYFVFLFLDIPMRLLSKYHKVDQIFLRDWNLLKDRLYSQG